MNSRSSFFLLLTIKEGIANQFFLQSQIANIYFLLDMIFANGFNQLIFFMEL